MLDRRLEFALDDAWISFRIARPGWSRPTSPGVRASMARSPPSAMHGGSLPWRSAATIPNKWLAVFVREDVALGEAPWGARETDLDYAFPSPRTRSGPSTPAQTR